jgi:hypothetical protein
MVASAGEEMPAAIGAIVLRRIDGKLTDETFDAEMARVMRFQCCGHSDCIIVEQYARGVAVGLRIGSLAGTATGLKLGEAINAARAGSRAQRDTLPAVTPITVVIPAGAIVVTNTIEPPPVVVNNTIEAQPSTGFTVERDGHGAITKVTPN